MAQDKEGKTPAAMESPLRFSLTDERGEIIETGKGLMLLEEDNLSLFPDHGVPLCFSLRDILEIQEGDYAFDLVLVSDGTLSLSHLGHRYQPFLSAVRSFHHETILKDLLVHESIKKEGIRATLTKNAEPPLECEVRLYETAMVLIPEKGDLIRLPYGDVSHIEEQDFGLTVVTDFEERFHLSRMARHLDPFRKTLSDCLNNLMARTQASLRDTLPDAGPVALQRAALLMKEGRAVRKSDLESISIEIWRGLERRLDMAGVGDEYEFLRHLAGSDPYIGFKRGLLGDFAGDYIWFMMPLYGASPRDPGNAIAMEAASEEGGRATYFFRIIPRADYTMLQDMSEVDDKAKEAITLLNRCMIAINFRREPIYLPEERLREPKYSKYRFSLRKQPALRTLRDRFIGRVVHVSQEQWEKGVMDLLRANTEVTGNDGKG